MTHGFSTGILTAAIAHFLVKNPIEFKDRYINVSTAPGLGIELNDEIIKKYRIFN